DNAMSHLVLPRRDIDIIRALSRKHDKGELSTWGADFIRGKGEGQVFLLHGPPGTGKTFTVECVAEYTRRPLLALTVADIGTAESRTEAHLSRWFTLAADWGAVLLLDEADVFLERRRTSDLARNSLVSVFLRTMEYYTGILFLTTNRIGQIDDAFLSRVQVALGYEKLDDHAREQIWYGFFEKLKKDRKDIIVTERAKRFVANDLVLKAMKWNGREIRNALQTAIALAHNDAEAARKAGEEDLRVEVTADHLEQVVERRKVFIEYTNSIRRETEEQRALGEGSRRDQDLR
ncbi:P-loop containing nucleoside triphosphate hydrolase protein, partial [Leptodontidium sp. MPI-SDFR-AT-0119]